MRRLYLLLLSMLFLLAGCLANSDLISSPSLTSVTILPSLTVTSTFTSIPSETITLTPAPPTLDPREYVVKTRKADVWDTPENEGKYLHLQTQLILGEQVLVVDRQGDWSKIVAVDQPSGEDPLGYPGWVHSDLLTQGWPSAQHYAIVMIPHSYLESGPDGAVLMSVYLDTRLAIESSQADWIQVRLPGGGTGWLSLKDVRLTENLSDPIPTDGLIALAKSLVGVPYQWGGTTTDSLDCSGLFYRVFHAYGRTLIRDASELALGGVSVARENLQEGDLIFTSSKPGGPVVHVAMYLGNDRVLDATEYYGVYNRSIWEFLHDNIWVTARQYLP